eukprot:TRINITY_DN48744_c0_g1_i1.p1 TRINITY_DN48744_c0_g1~~TRINITY_DN48744_c0_g1_i1.p1  ORF type:complete len:627 (-),score=120.81 TRINITY_DN48744_c0_g1_i1:336-2165(-)
MSSEEASKVVEPTCLQQPIFTRSAMPMRAAVACLDTEILLEGTLEKCSERLGIWQARHVQVSKQFLRYFKEGCQESRAEFGPGDVEDVGEELPSTVLVVARMDGGEERLYRFKATDADTMKLWVDVIRDAFNLKRGGEVAQSKLKMAAAGPGWSLFSKATTSAGYGVQKVAKATGSEHLLLYARSKSASFLEDIGQKMEDALMSCDEGKTEILLDKALALGMDSQRVPLSVRKAARRIAGRNLKRAVQSGDPTRLKGALVAAKRLHAADVPEFDPAVEMYSRVRRLPKGWDVARMVEEREHGGAKLLVRTDVTNNLPVLNLIQLMFDRTVRRVVTRDRKGGAVPLRYDVVRVQEVQHENMWAEYMERREEIREVIKSTRTPEGSLPPDHVLVNADTETPLAEAQSLNSIGPLQATSSRGKLLEQGEPAAKHLEIINPETGQPLRLWMTGPPGVLLQGELASSLHGPELDTTLNEAWLLHGTKPTAAEKITKDDFRIHMAGTSTGTLYGRGIYFAENSTKADEYCHPDPTSGLCTMLICRVVLGRILYNDEVTPDPRHLEEKCLKGDFQAVLGDRRACRGTFREFAVFDEDAIYPSYIVTYKRVMERTGG